ncbi:MAG: sulfite exporter TauE/SafE family protein [Clostridia bacterium]|nr:sulfite exporter TauE/SafE family protein [Clostridia bacterium]
MEYVWYGIAGVLGGLLGGMGMGGGTILIPLLNIFFSVKQHSAQAANLISFLPMATIALIIHLKNGLVEFRGILLIIISGILSCFLGYYFASSMSSNLLQRFFGGFLTILSVVQFVSVIGAKKDSKVKKIKENEKNEQVKKVDKT